MHGIRQGVNMSRQIARDAINLKPTPRIAHTEYSLAHHKEYVARLQPQSILDAWDIDFPFTTNNGPIRWADAGRVTDMGHAGYDVDGSDFRPVGDCPFTDAEEIYEFDPAREYGLPGHRELVKFYEEAHQARNASNPNQLWPGGYYPTVVSGAIQSFGWDMLLLAAADLERFAEVLRRFAAYTAHYVAAWAETSIEVFIQHDDMVWSDGPFLRPDFYRGVIFPLYKSMWAPLKKAGKKIMYCSDGTFDMFMEDILDCGADGLIFEPSNDFAGVVRRFGRRCCLVGSKVDCRTLAAGNWDKVKQEMDDTLALARDCAGLIWAVGNHLAPNISDEMMDLYINYLRRHWQR